MYDEIDCAFERKNDRTTTSFAPITLYFPKFRKPHAHTQRNDIEPAGSFVHT